MKEPKPRAVGVNDSKSIVGKILGDGLTGSCFRAVEQAAAPDVEVSIYVRSYPEADIALMMVLSMAQKRGLFDPSEMIDREKVSRTSRALGAVVAVELNNGSVIAFKKETAPAVNG